MSLLTNEKEIANTMKNYFINITKHLNLKPHTASNTMDLEQITSAFNNHVSIKKMREVFPEISSNNFEFTKVTEQSVKNEVLKLNTKKSPTGGSIPATILKQFVETYLPFLTKAINLAITECKFPDKLKKSEVIPLYKKQDPLKKENYHPISLLPHVSKVFDRILYAPINNFMQNKISKYVTGFCKLHGTQNSLMIMLEKPKNVLDKREYVYVLFMDLSKAFDTINHDLLLAKLRAYGFSNNALNLMGSYLKNRKQRTQVNNNFSSEKNIIAGVPQGSIDGPLLFNLFINDLIFFITTFLSNYADDNSLYSTGKDLELVKSVLVNDFRKTL